MKTLNVNQMEIITGGFPWASAAAGFFCGLGLVTAETGVGLLIAGASCAAAGLSDD
jgi:hypothetical protein